jgi:hypothetical protein
VIASYRSTNELSLLAVASHVARCTSGTKQIGEMLSLKLCNATSHKLTLKASSIQFTAVIHSVPDNESIGQQGRVTGYATGVDLIVLRRRIKRFQMWLRATFIYSQRNMMKSRLLRRRLISFNFSPICDDISCCRPTRGVWAGATGAAPAYNSLHSQRRISKFTPW